MSVVQPGPKSSWPPSSSTPSRPSSPQRFATSPTIPGETVSAFTSPNKTSGTPILLSGKHSKDRICVLTIPRARGELYRYPQDVLRSIRDVTAQDIYVRLDATAIESFSEEPAQAKILTNKRITKLRDMETSQDLTGQAQGNSTVFETPLTRGTCRAFAAQ